MLATFTAVTGALKTASDTVKGMIGLRDAAVFLEKSIELQSQISAAYSAAIEAQESQMALLQRNRDLEAEIMKLKGWEAEKERYELKELPPGIFVRALKAGMENGDPAHELCEPCYQKNIKSILQRGERSNGIQRLRCGNGCPELRAGNFVAPAVKYARGGPDGWMR